MGQGFERKYPEHIGGLYFFNCPYPGIGKRWVDPGSGNEIWYQSFNQQPWAASLVGKNRKTCEVYFRHFLDHWAHEPGLFDDDLRAWVDNFMKPGNLQVGFDWYISSNGPRWDLVRNGPPEMPRIETPTRVLWRERPHPEGGMGRSALRRLLRCRLRTLSGSRPLRPLRAARRCEPRDPGFLLREDGVIGTSCPAGSPPT